MSSEEEDSEGPTPEMKISQWDEVHRLFDQIDEDGDGTLSRKELKDKLLQDKQQFMLEFQLMYPVLQ